MGMGIAVQHAIPHEHAGMLSLDGGMVLEGSTVAWTCCSVHVFGLLKKLLKSFTIRLDKDMVQWFQQQPREFYVDGIYCLVCQWDACLNAHGSYF
jgi:hypothetical protein